MTVDGRRIDGLPPMTPHDVFFFAPNSSLDLCARHHDGGSLVSNLINLSVVVDRLATMRVSVLYVLLWAPLSFGFAPQWRAAPPVMTQRPTFLFSSALDDEEEKGNETTGIPDSAKFVIAEESGMEAEFESFGAFLSGNETSAEPSLPSSTDDTMSTNETSTTVLWTRLLSLASRTGRGEFASNYDKATAMNIIRALEQEHNPTLSPAESPLALGTWELVYSSTQLFRSSPFFMAGRAVCQDGEQAQQYDWFCDMHRKALAISNIGAVRQVVSNTTLISEFEVKVGAVPFLGAKWPFAYSGGLPVSTTYKEDG